MSNNGPSNNDASNWLIQTITQTMVFLAYSKIISDNSKNEESDPMEAESTVQSVLVKRKLSTTAQADDEEIEERAKKRARKDL